MNTPPVSFLSSLAKVVRGPLHPEGDYQCVTSGSLCFKIAAQKFHETPRLDATSISKSSEHPVREAEANHRYDECDQSVVRFSEDRAVEAGRDRETTPQKNKPAKKCLPHSLGARPVKFPGDKRASVTWLDGGGKMSGWGFGMAMVPQFEMNVLHRPADDFAGNDGGRNRPR